MLERAIEIVDAANGDATEKLQTLMAGLKELRPDFHWVGIYFLHAGHLYVGPYAGPKTDHIKIPVGRGVCGTAVAEDRNQIVDDVTDRDNYLACNLETLSEIVVLLRQRNGAVIAQFDIDASKKSAFTSADEEDLTRLGEHVLPLLEEAYPQFVPAAGQP